LSDGGTSSGPTGRRLDQWLWFARFVKSRSLASRLCAAGAVAVNGAAVRKANHMVRVGDAIAVPRGAFCHRIRVLALGARRGPAMEARLMYEETAAPVRLSDLAPAWTPLFAEEERWSDLPPISIQKLSRY
jgi:ribosome-associated heat shock protein Hsp15